MRKRFVDMAQNVIYKMILAIVHNILIHLKSNRDLLLPMNNDTNLEESIIIKEYHALSASDVAILIRLICRSIHTHLNKKTHTNDLDF